MINPNTVKSQDDTTEDELGRTMTLLRAIEQLEKTECKLEKVEKQLDIAKKYLKWIIDTTEKGHICCDACGYQIECKGCEYEEWAKDALKRIERLNK